MLVASSLASRAPAEPIAQHLLHSRGLLGDPGGWRGRLQEFGIGLQLFYQQVLAWKPAGGGANPAGAFGHSGSYDFFTLADVDQLVGWPGLDFLFHLKGQYDRNVNDDVGALSDPIDDADFDAPIYVDELWLQQALFDDRVRLRAGFMEQQTVFDRNAYANSEDRQFLNTFLDNNPLVPLPNGLAAALMLDPLGSVELAMGAADADNVPRRAGFDTAFDGIDSVTGYLELTWRTAIPSAAGTLPGSYRAGMFVDGREPAAFDVPGGSSVGERGHLGAYLSVDQLAYRERAEGEEGLGLFARFGYLDPKAGRIAWFWSLGLQYEGPLPCRDADVLGIGVYQAIGSASYQDEVDPDFEGETGIEFYYRIAALPWLTVTQDFQYVIDPGGEGRADPAAMVALRFRVGF